MNIKKITKILMIVSLVCLAASCGLLIGAVFGLDVFGNKVLQKVLLMSSTFAIAGGLAIGEVNVLQKNKVLGCISLGLLGLSVLLTLVSLFIDFDGVFTKITIITSLISVLFCFVVSIYTKFGKSFLALQICTYVALTLLDAFFIMLTLGIGILEKKGMLECFIILIIASVGLLIAVKVISSRKKDALLSQSESHKSELDDIKIQLEKLTQENEDLRQQITTLTEENKQLKEKLQ